MTRPSPYSATIGILVSRNPGATNPPSIESRRRSLSAPVSTEYVGAVEGGVGGAVEPDGLPPPPAPTQPTSSSGMVRTDGILRISTSSDLGAEARRVCTVLTSAVRRRFPPVDVVHGWNESARPVHQYRCDGKQAGSGHGSSR